MAKHLITESAVNKQTHTHTHARLLPYDGDDIRPQPLTEYCTSSIRSIWIPNRTTLKPNIYKCVGRWHGYSSCCLYDPGDFSPDHRSKIVNGSRRPTISLSLSLSLGNSIVASVCVRPFAFYTLYPFTFNSFLIVLSWLSKSTSTNLIMLITVWWLIGRGSFQKWQIQIYHVF